MSEEFLPTSFQQYIHKSKYSRWDYEKNRRETWEETVDRYLNFFKKHLKENNKYELDTKTVEDIRQAILNLDVMPSMRCLMTAGPALERDNSAAYNCGFIAFDKKRKFDELMYNLMCGTGVGFSVERQYINKLPTVADELYPTDTTIHVRDSRTGWAAAYKELISLLYAGQIPKWDVSKVRPAGAKLKTFGGTASGPGVLEDLFRFTIDVFKNAQGRQLTSIEVHDIACKIGEVVVAGGTRRSALLSLSNLSDIRMREAKSGQWWVDQKQRRLANNSVAYTEKPDVGIFMEEWLALYKSKSGERGIFNREAIRNKISSLPGEKRESNKVVGVNPCGEILLRDEEFCNLSSVVLRPTDSIDRIREKVRIASILGTWQATLTNFRYINNSWKHNCEEEALIGVSLTGIMDHPKFNDYQDKDQKLSTTLTALKEEVININKDWAKRLGINPAAATTCVKPEGTTSSLVNSSSGIHPRFSDYYIRTVRENKTNPLAQFLVDSGVPHEDELNNPAGEYVFSFPVKSPNKSINREHISAIQQLELWKIYQKYWCEHNPSITVNIREDEWLEVGNWVFTNFDEIGGISFLPYSDHTYRQAPFQEIDKDQYHKLVKEMPQKIDWDKLSEYENEDNTSGSREYACSGPEGCEVR